MASSTTTAKQPTERGAKKKATGKKVRKRAKKQALTARTADKHVLYQASVQAPDHDAKTYARWFKKYTGRDLRSLREDFCGTAVLACHHVKNHKENTAVGVDLDRPTLDWGIEHNVKTLLDEEQQRRLTLLEKNVLDVTSPKVDCALALNFSYGVFKTRKDLGAYIKTVHKSLKPGGVFYMDALGGPDVMQAKTDVTRKQGFKYHWEQKSYDPISHRFVCAIHFEFPDGTMMKNAFVYDWRLWTLAELRELFEEAGFEDVHVLWEATDLDTMEGNGVFRRKEIGDMDEAWISIVVGKKKG
ncbi:MAG: class I SAM-dependent methyltransferase [Planctomycetes bacterium]|nr:class I SAM-dependent methyltransferase [Planctomycetota bacterium]